MLSDMKRDLSAGQRNSHMGVPDAEFTPQVREKFREFFLLATLHRKVFIFQSVYTRKVLLF